jgi:hypothetical protein
MDLSHPPLSVPPAPAAAGNEIDRRIRAALGRAGDPVKPPRMGLPGARALDDAPGRYVLEK